MKIIIGGGFTYVPFSPGAAWTRLELALGLKKMGHNVLVVEQVGDGWCYDRNGAKTTFEKCWSRELFARMMNQFGILHQASQIYNHGEETTGLTLRQVLDFARGTDLLINNSGHIKMESILEAVEKKIYVDLDPVYTQLWYAVYGKHQSLDVHDVFFTVGANIGTERCEIPDCGKVWHYLPRIVDFDHWFDSYDPNCKAFTTVANWAGYGELQYKNKTFRPKYSEFMHFAELPDFTTQPLEVCMKNYDPGDPRIRTLVDFGWSIRNSTEVINTLESYQHYIAGSRGEIGIAQNAYVAARSGWFSDRSAHYLASGKPVVAQSTGFENHLPAGLGLFAFETAQEAAQSIERINQNYKTHSDAARQIAEDHFDYRKVLPEMLNSCFG